jgi:RimJ/RimL family protein N-acetyltransferase
VRAASIDRSTYGFTWVPIDRADADRYIAKALNDHAGGTALPFVQRRADTGEVVGSTRYLNIEHWSWAESTGWPDAVEIGSTWLSASAQRSRVNSEAKLLLLGHAFDQWGVQRVAIKTDALNAVSRTAIERLGARFEGIVRHQLPAFGRSGPRDTALYSIIPAEWPAIRERLSERLRR